MAEKVTGVSNSFQWWQDNEKISLVKISTTFNFGAKVLSYPWNIGAVREHVFHSRCSCEWTVEPLVVIGDWSNNFLNKKYECYYENIDLTVLWNKRYVYNMFVISIKSKTYECFNLYSFVENTYELNILIVKLHM